MPFLPIVQRELAAAARRRSTFRLRSWTAVCGALVTGSSLLLLWMVRGGTGVGGELFGVLTTYAMGLSLISGVFLTSDTLSAEKREGTLGLLFLTDLRGYDVVLGKFAGMTINAFYGLFALLPVMAVAFLLGGLTPGEFWRTALALVNALFFSLACGVWVSALARNAHRAMGGTLILLAVLVVGGPWLRGVGLLLHLPKEWLAWGWVSPWHVFRHASAARFGAKPFEFWNGLLVSHALGWGFLLAASLALPRAWQEKEIRSPRSTRAIAGPRRSPARPPREPQPRPKHSDEYPVLRLMGDAPVIRVLAWVIVGTWCLLALGAAQLPVFRNSGFFYYAGQGPMLLLKILIAVQACRFFSEARRNGTLDLLLCTPLRNTDILKAQWLMLWNIFWAPLAVFLLALLLLVAVGPGWTDENGGFSFARGSSLLLVFWQIASLAADILAIGWYGPWLSLSMKRPALAVPSTIVLVLLLPTFLCAMGIFADLFFFLYGYTRLQQDFRWTLASQYR